MNDSSMVDSCPVYDQDTEVPSTEETYTFFNRVVNGYLTLLCVAVGILGNSYSIYLLRRRFNVRATISTYLRVLAMWDVLLLLCTPWYYSLEAALPNLSPAYEEVFSFITVSTHSIGQIAMASSIWMSVVITSERHWAILSPLKHRTIDSTQRSRFICCVTGLCSIIFNIPTFFELRVFYCTYWPNSTLNIRSYADGTDLRKNEAYILFYQVIGNLMFKTLVPFISIFLLTIRMISAVREQQKTRDLATAGHRYRKELYTTAMLLALATKFLVCHCLPSVVNIMELKAMANTISTTEPNVQRYLIDISNILVVLNSATNWMIYCYWKKHFVAHILLRPYRHHRVLYKKELTNDSQILYAAPALAAMKAQEAYFSSDEAEVLQRIWTESLKFSDPPFGQKVLVSLIRKLPELFSYFSNDNILASEPYQKEIILANLHFHPKIQAQGAVITDFFELMVFGAGDLRSETRMTYYIRHVGQHHKDRPQIMSLSHIFTDLGSFF